MAETDLGEHGDANMARWQPMAYPCFGDSKYLLSEVDSPSEVIYTCPADKYFYIYAAEYAAVVGSGDRHSLDIKDDDDNLIYTILFNYYSAYRGTESHVAYFMPLILLPGYYLYHYVEAASTTVRFSVYGIEAKAKLGMRFGI